MFGKRDQVVGTHEEIELGGQDPSRLLLVHREVQHDEHVFVVLVQLRAVVPGVDVLVVERMELEVGLEPVPIRKPWCLDVDPADAGRLDDVGRTQRHRRRRLRRRRPADGGRAVGGAAVVVGARCSARRHRSRASRGAEPVAADGRVPPAGCARPAAGADRSRCSTRAAHTKAPEGTGGTNLSAGSSSSEQVRSPRSPPGPSPASLAAPEPGSRDRSVDRSPVRSGGSHCPFGQDEMYLPGHEPRQRPYPRVARWYRQTYPRA